MRLYLAKIKGFFDLFLMLSLASGKWWLNSWFGKKSIYWSFLSSLNLTCNVNCFFWPNFHQRCSVWLGSIIVDYTTNSKNLSKSDVKKVSIENLQPLLKIVYEKSIHSPVKFWADQRIVKSPTKSLVYFRVPKEVCLKLKLAKCFLIEWLLNLFSVRWWINEFYVCFVSCARKNWYLTYCLFFRINH